MKKIFTMLTVVAISTTLSFAQQGSVAIGVGSNLADVSWQDYSLTPTGEANMNIDFNTLTARPGMMGGCMATPLFNTIQQYMKTKLKGKGIKTSAITSVAGMATHRIMHCIDQMNKSVRLKKLK